VLLSGTLFIASASLLGRRGFGLAYDTEPLAARHLGKRWLKAIDVISFGTLVAEYPILGVARFAADDAVALAGGFVAALVAEPVAVGDVFHGRFEAVGVVAFIAAVAQQELVLLVAAVAELAAGFHDALVPRDRRLQHVEAHGHLSGCFAASHRFSPRDQRFGRVARRALTRQHAHHQIALTVHRNNKFNQID